MLKHTAMERDNLHKMQQIQALNVSSTINGLVSPRANYPLDLKRKSQSLSKTLTQCKRQQMHAMNLAELQDEGTDEGQFYDSQDLSREVTFKRAKSPPKYNEIIKEKIKRKVSEKLRYETKIGSPSERVQNRRYGAYEQAESFLKNTESHHNKKMSQIPEVRPQLQEQQQRSRSPFRLVGPTQSQT